MSPIGAAMAGMRGSRVLTSYTFHGVTADADVYGNSDTYSVARSTGLGLFQADTTNPIYFGQLHASGGGDTDYICIEALIGFDTSSLPDTATIVSATLSIFGHTDNSTGADFTMEARLHDWGATAAAADFVAGADLGSKTLLASYPTSSFSTVAYMDFTSEAAFPANINKTGVTRMVLCSSRHRAGNAPANDTNEYVRINSGDEGSTKRPKLVVVAAV